MATLYGMDIKTHPDRVEAPRTWRERLLSWPWRPWVRTKQVENPIFKGRPHDEILVLGDTIIMRESQLRSLKLLDRFSASKFHTGGPVTKTRPSLVGEKPCGHDSMPTFTRKGSLYRPQDTAALSKTLKEKMTTLPPFDPDLGGSYKYHQRKAETEIRRAFACPTMTAPYKRDPKPDQPVDVYAQMARVMKDMKGES